MALITESGAATEVDDYPPNVMLGWLPRLLVRLLVQLPILLLMILCHAAEIKVILAIYQQIVVVVYAREMAYVNKTSKKSMGTLM